MAIGALRFHSWVWNLYIRSRKHLFKCCSLICRRDWLGMEAGEEGLPGLGVGIKLRGNNRVGRQKLDRVECAFSPQGGGTRT